MSYRAQVTDTPVQLVYGSQRENVTLTNVGANTVYLSNDSSVTANSDLVLDAGGSILVEPKTIIWGVCGAGLTSQVAVTSSVGERFAYAGQSYKIISQTTVTNMGPGSGTGTLQFGNVNFDNSPQTQFSAIGIFFNTNNVAANTSISWIGKLNSVTIPTQYVMVRSGTNGSQTIGAIFPVKSLGGQWQIQPDALIGNSTITIVGYPNALYPYPVAYADPRGLAVNWNGAAGAWSYNGSVPISNNSNVYLPPIIGSARITISYTQAVAGPTGSFTITPNIARTVTGLYWTASYIQYDTAINTASAATYLQSFNWSNVPPSPIRLNLVTDAITSISNLWISVDQNK